MDKLKPYTLALVEVPDSNVEGGLRRFTGELMSFPVPVPVKDCPLSKSSTIMVRTVPGIAATLIEVPTSSVTPIRARTGVNVLAEVMPLYTWRDFPFDMLRYDNCVPYSFAIEGTRVIKEKDLDKGFPIVSTFCARSGVKRAYTYDRWRSFGFEVKIITKINYPMEGQ